MNIEKVLAFDIGGTKIAYAVVEKDGNLLSEVVRIPTPKTAEDIFNFLKSTASFFEKEFDAVAIATAGTVDKSYKGLTAPTGNLPEGYEQINFSKISTKPVLVVNDANAAVWAEYKKGAAVGCSDVVLLTLGTGVGVGIIANGHLIIGKSGGAGEVHFPVRGDKHRRCGCGRYDCLEIYMSGKALNLDAKEFYGDASATSYDVIEGLKSKNYQAENAFSHWQDMVRLGVVMFADIFDPEVVLLGGSMAHFIDYKKINSSVNDEIISSPVLVKEAAFENDAGIIGAALLAVEKL